MVYCTRSVYAEENEQLVKRVLEKAHTHSKLLPFRVNGPIFSEGSQSGETTDSKFFQLEASQFTNGCFIARLSRQADPTKVETVHDVLSRAAAKGLLGGMIPEQSKPAKKGKSKKSRAASAGSKPSRPSSQEGQMGSEVEEEPVAASEREEKRGEHGEEREEGKEVDKEGKRGKKARGLKGGKRKLKGQTSRTTEASKQNLKSRTTKSTKTKVNQAHHKRRLPRSKPRRIPRLTLTLMSSAKPSNHLSPITALAHKLSNSPTVKSQQNDIRAPAPARPAPLAPYGASKQVQGRSTEPERAEGTRKDVVRPESPFKDRGKVFRPRKEDLVKPADFVLPGISSPSSGSASSRSQSSSRRRPFRASHSQLAQISASPSSVYLPSL